MTPCLLACSATCPHESSWPNNEFLQVEEMLPEKGIWIPVTVRRVFDWRWWYEMLFHLRWPCCIGDTQQFITIVQVDMKHLTDTLIGDSPGFKYPQTERPMGHLALANNISCSWGTQTPPMACQSRPSTTGARFLFWGAVLTLSTSQHVGIEQHVRFGAMNLMKV